METTSWIYGRYKSTGNYSSWCSLYDCMRLGRYENFQTSRDNSGIWWVHKHSEQSFTPFMFIEHSNDLDNSRRTMQYPKHWKLLPSGSRSTHLTSHIYCLFKSLERNIIEQIWDAMQYAIWYRFRPLRTPVNFWTSQQDSWWELSPGYLQTILNNNDTVFCSISAWSRDALHDIRPKYQFSWHLSVYTLCFRMKLPIFPVSHICNVIVF